MLKFSNKIYDMLKFVALIALPALASLYLGLGQLWDWSATEQVVASLVLLDTFLGVLLQINTSRYNNDPENYDGYLGSSGVHPDTGIPNLQLTVTTPPDELLSGKMVRLKVGDAPKVA